jgi:hypothetical protein
LLGASRPAPNRSVPQANPLRSTRARSVSLVLAGISAVTKLMSCASSRYMNTISLRAYWPRSVRGNADPPIGDCKIHGKDALFESIPASLHTLSVQRTTVRGLFAGRMWASFGRTSLCDDDHGSCSGQRRVVKWGPVLLAIRSRLIVHMDDLG